MINVHHTTAPHQSNTSSIRHELLLPLPALLLKYIPQPDCYCLRSCPHGPQPTGVRSRIRTDVPSRLQAWSAEFERLVVPSYCRYAVKSVNVTDFVVEAGASKQRVSGEQCAGHQIPSIAQVWRTKSAHVSAMYRALWATHFSSMPCPTLPTLWTSFHASWLMSSK